IVADWAHRGMLIPLDELAGAGEMVELEEWLFPAARKLGEHDGRLFALCNGLDIRALYYNQTLLAEHGLSAPRTLAELDRIAETIAPPDQTDHARFGYLPDSRRLWAWGVVFGGDFYDEPSGAATLTDPAIGRALEWMGGYRRRYGGKTIANFRQGDQALPGAAFPLLPTGSASPHGRYAVIMDGQWRVRDIAEASRQRLADGLPVAEYGVCPLPPPADGDANAGWVNGNFFLCLRGCRNPAGAWEFMKFWSGFPATSGDAAKTCADGGWIPVSQRVVDEPAFQDFLAARPLFRQFVELAASPNQEPIPIVPGAAFFDRAVRDAGGDAMQSDNQSPRQILERANSRVNEHLTRRTQGGRP
ncbi:MAG: extracellular solute-binding protein, partial [Pirellulaceae bacterium]|nr:extracellular solute-binding protein [Pirellulaceae bacterium]